VNTLLYPYSRLAYESIVGFENFFLVNAMLMLRRLAQTAPAAWRYSPQSGTMPVGEAGGRPTPSRPCRVRRCCGTKVKVF
jgi:hypothetical protein